MLRNRRHDGRLFSLPHFMLLAGLLLVCSAASADPNGSSSPRPSDMSTSERLEAQPELSSTSLRSSAAACPSGSTWATTTGTGDWTTVDWGLSGKYPDNDNPGPNAEANHCARIDGGIVTVDEPIEVDGLELLNGAIVRVNQVDANDLTIQRQGPFIVGDLSGLPTQIHVDYSRQVSNPGGTILFYEDGGYQADPLSVSFPVSTHLSADTIIMVHNRCDATEQVTINQSMNVVTTGDFVLDGSAPGVICGVDLVVPRASGGKTPPIIRMGNPVMARPAGGAATQVPAVRASVEIGGSFRMLENAFLSIACDGVDVDLRGDFGNESKWPSNFHWRVGTLRMGPDELSDPPHPPQTFEVGGKDFWGQPDNPIIGFGPVPAIPPDLRSSDNFSMGKLRILSGADVTFQNAKLNTVGTGPCDEALYVRQLIVESGASITLDNVRIYAGQVSLNGSTPTMIGTCSALVDVVGQLPDVPGDCLTAFGIPAASSWGLAVMAMLLMIAGTMAMLRRRLATA